MKWQSIQEWKQWLNDIQNMQWNDFCKRYQMEIMVWFFIVSWYLPAFRSLIIFFWSRMILPTLDYDDDTQIIILLKLLSYFAPLVSGYLLWNQMAAWVS